MKNNRHGRSRPSIARSYKTFAHEVRRRPLTPLLRELSRHAWAAVEQRLTSDQPLGVVQEFTLGGIARVALQHGNDHRSTPRRMLSLEALCAAYINIDEPGVGDGNLDLSQMLARLAYEQMPAQSIGVEAFGRVHVLATDHLPFVKNGPTPEDWESALGVPLTDYWRIGWILSVALASNEGAIAWTTLALDHVATLFAPLKWDQVRPVIEQHLAQTIPQAQNLARSRVYPPSPKWSYSPLEQRPLLDTGEELICPAPHFLSAQLTPTGIYYLGLDHFGSTFGQALGDACESYVGAQLDLLTHAVVHREITYDKDSKKSCDYIVITDECVLLIECKSGRPNIEARLGNGTDSMKKISKGKAQLETTAQLIKDRHTSFSHIPDDRPMLGLVVTLEPHYLTQTLSEDILFSDVLPITDATVQDLELTTAALADRVDLGERLRDRIWPYPPWAPRPPDLRKAVTDLAETAPRNPIVEAGWDVLTDLPAIELAQRNGDGSPPVASVDGPWDAADVGDGVLG